MFTTERLTVDEWHRLSDRYGLDLGDVVTSVLTARTTAPLPPEWHGDFDHERAEAWINGRDAESPTLLVVETTTGDAVGLVILFESPGTHEGSRWDLRIGYVLAEATWGRGLATELVGGLVGWAEAEPTLGSISGGVAIENEASARVLRKNGFTPIEERNGERIFSRACPGRDRTDGHPGRA